MAISTANTIIVKDLLQADTIKNLDKNTVITPHANRKFQASLRRQGDTATVQYVPFMRGQRGGASGDNIPIQTTTLESYDLQVNQLVKDNRRIDDLEIIRSNLELRDQFTNRMAEYLAQVHENHIALAAVKDVHADNVINEGNPEAIDKSDVHAEIEEMRVKLSKKNAFGNASLFVSPHVASMLRQSGIYDGFVEGLNKRTTFPMNGYIGKLSGFMIYETNNLPHKQKVTIDTQATDGDTVTIALYDIEADATTTVTLTYKTTLTGAAGEILIGASAETSYDNLQKLINKSGTVGTHYSEPSASDRALLDEYEVYMSDDSSNIGYFYANRPVTLGETFTAPTNIFGTAGIVMFGMDREAVNFVEQMANFKVTEPDDAFRAQLLYENVFQADVHGENAKRIVTNEIQNS